MEPSQILRPLSLGEILDRAFRIYRNHFLALTGIVALLIVPFTILEILSLIRFGGAQIVNLLQSVFVFCLVQGTLAQAFAAAYLGEPFSIGAAYRAGLRRYFSLWGALFLEGLVIGLPLVLLICAPTALVGLGRSSVTCFLVILVLLFVPYAVYFGTRWLVTVPGIMREELGATQGLSRSWELTSDTFWRVLGLSTLSFLLSFFITQLPGLIVLYGLRFLLPGEQIGPLLEPALTGFSTILAWPFSIGVSVLLYYDLRVRKEGYDLQVQAQALSAQKEEESGEK